MGPDSKLGDSNLIVGDMPITPPQLQDSRARKRIRKKKGDPFDTRET